MSSFSSRLIAWQRTHGRHNLPWQGASAYHVWLSEIMLQQTQVATVIPYFRRFVVSFPTIAALAAANEEQVLAHWSGLGYYARGRNLHRTAQIIAGQYGGEFPRQFEQILNLPGIGRSTAAAICALAHHERRAILDGNVKRVLARYCGISGSPSEKPVETQLWQQAEALLPKQKSPLPVGERVREITSDLPACGLSRMASGSIRSGSDNTIATYTQALMDLGATLCTRSKPKCGECPANTDCVAFQSGRVNELPTPRPRKAVPERHSTFLLLMSGRDILLEKRAPQGIWGGLWCPPQLEEGQGDETDYVQRSGIEVSERIKLPGFNHTFTHFKLHITPVLLRVEHKPQLVQQPGSMWIDMEDALLGAIPTPVRKMLKSINSRRS
ncbi:MAG: A/G-specific adenine glycosylase [Pseudomonadota bacterium]